MKEHVVKFAALLLVCCLILSCGKDVPQSDDVESVTGSIYGTVTDKSTGDCVSIAGVELMPKGLKTVTGSDGTFQFTDIEPGQYNLFITKVGYQDYKSSTITVKSGETAKGDAQIEKMPASLQIVDNSGNAIAEIDFGSDEGVTSKTFNIFNGGVETLNYTITKTADWIESISQPTGSVGVGVTFPIIIGINRELLTNGLNSTTLLITSPSAGGVELTIKATFDYHSAFSVVNNNGVEITEIDFGSDENITQKTFMIRNDGNQNISYEITKTANWITNISQASGSVNVGATIPIILSINRTALSDGLNSTSLSITTPSAGGVELVVKATKTVFGATCKIVFDLFDSAGDGWNGGAHLDFNDGVSDHSMTCNGNYSSFVFEYPVDTYISVTYTGGSYNGENSYKIRYEDGSMIYQSTSNIPSGFQCYFVVDCDSPNPGGGGGGNTNYGYNFDDGSMMSWTSLDADGDGKGWTSSSNPGIYHNSNVNLSGTGHNSSEAYVISGSYANQGSQALTPDNYLVSPQKYTISSSSTISFYVCAQDINYPAEHYGVAISNAPGVTSPSASSFTTIWEETLSAKGNKGGKSRGMNDQGNWYLKTIDLSAYAGQTIWIAIRHFNCTDQFIINIDDVTIKQ